MTKVFIINGNNQYKQLFTDAGFQILNFLTEDVPDLVCFTGGEDVSPFLYGEGEHPATYSSSHRDMHEKKLFLEFKEASIPMVGICRGGQFLNVMNGGRMFQHVSKHTYDHAMTDAETGNIIIATSTHHQMMRPSENGIIIATAGQDGFKQFVNELNNVEDFVEEIRDVEVVLYPETSCLCFQPHPEFGSEALKEYFISLVKKHLI